MKTFDFYDRGSDRPWINPMLTNTVIVGHTTATSAKLWMRAYQPNSYRMLVSPEPILNHGEVATDWNPKTKTENGKEIFFLENANNGDTREIAGALLTDQADLAFEHDITKVWEINGLQPGQRYYYAAFALDLKTRKTPWEIAPDNKVNRFKTQSGSQDSMTFGLFSCHMPYQPNSYRMLICPESILNHGEV